MSELEHAFQMQVMNYLDYYGRRELFWFAIPNGGKRHPATAVRLKQEGVKPGVADICIMLDQGRSAWLELKAKHGTLSDAQVGFGAKAHRLGHRWTCVRSMAEAEAILSNWKVLR